MIKGPVRRRRFRRSSVHRWAIGLSVMLGIALLAFAAYYSYEKRAQQAAREAKQAADREAQAAAQTIAQSLKAHFAELERLGRDKQLVEIFRAGDENAFKAKGEELKGRFPSALKLRLFLPGTARLQNDETPPLSFASLELLRNAEATPDAIGAEAHLWGTPKQHVVMVRRVMDGSGQLAGLIHLSAEVGLLTSVMDTLQVSAGYLEVQQGERQGPPLVLVKRGEGGPQPGLKPANAPIPGTRWAVLVWPPASSPLALARRLLLDRPWDMGLKGALAVSLVVLPVFLGLAWRLRRGRLPADDEAGLSQGASPELSHKTQQKSLELEKTVPSTTLLERTPMENPEQSRSRTSATSAPDSIFRAYDIRGVVGETLTEEGVYAIGRALGSEAQERGQQVFAVGRDGRASSPALAKALQRGLCDSGRDVIDIGLVPTPVLYFATYHLGTKSGVMITGSHNPPHYNGLKIVLDDLALSGEAITAIRDRIRRGNFTSGMGKLGAVDVNADYIHRITDDIPVALSKALKVVVDCGNGVPGILAPKLIRALGHEVIELFCEVDATFPNHHPDPSQPENLHDLIETVRREKADLGLAFDGDGDRLGVVDGQGQIIWPDRQMMLFAKDVLSRNPGREIIFDVKCSRHLSDVVKASGGVPLMWKTGHSLIKTKMREIGAPLAGEMSGHIFFKERWYGFDDALYAAARLLEILVRDPRPPAEVFAELPGGVATPELRLDMPETEHAAFMARLIETASFEGAQIHTVDGLRVDFPDGWGLIRPSNTTPCLILRFEADDQGALERIQSQFRTLIKRIGPELTLPF